MPRRSSGGRSGSRAARRSASPRNPMRTARSAPPPAPAQGGGSILGGIGATIADGMAFGAGSAIARRAVDAVLGRPTVQHEKAASPASGAAADSATGPTSKGSDACTTHVKAFQDCINNYESDISKCQFYMDMLNECRQGSGAVSR